MTAKGITKYNFQPNDSTRNRRKIDYTIYADKKSRKRYPKTIQYNIENIGHLTMNRFKYM